MDKWKPEIFIGLFWRDKSCLRGGCNNKDEYRYLINLSLNDISQNNLSYWKKKSDLNKSQYSYQVMDNGKRDIPLILEKPNNKSLDENFRHEENINNLMRCFSLRFL